MTTVTVKPRKRVYVNPNEVGEDNSSSLIKRIDVAIKNQNLVLCVTMNTLVDDKSFVDDPNFLWTENFIWAIRKRLPEAKRNFIQIDHYHRYHPSLTNNFRGVVIIPKDYAHLIWMRGRAVVHDRLTSELNSWKKNVNGNRPCIVNDFKIENLKVKNVSSSSWVKYCENLNS